MWRYYVQLKTSTDNKISKVSTDSICFFLKMFYENLRFTQFLTLLERKLFLFKEEINKSLNLTVKMIIEFDYKGSNYSRLTNLNANVEV